jgi:DNA-binding ferritin-like protein (Dps family)
MNKIVSYESCGVVNQPIDYDGIVDYAKEVVGEFDALSPTAQSDALTNAILNILKNNNLTNNNTTLFSFVKSIVESILTPKVLFPIMALGQVIEKTASAQYELVRGRADEFITQNNKAIKNFTDEGIDSAESFAKKYKAYLQNVTRRVLELFLKELFNTLKGKLKKLVSRVVGGVFKNYSKKQVQVILALSTGLLGIIATITNFRKCKSVIESIGKILNSINILTKAAIIPIPPPLLIGAQFLPGFSNERAKINVIAEMQSLGLPTEDLLDGTPNRVLLFAEAVINGTDNEEITNGAVDGFIDPLLTGRVFAKKRHG